MRQSASPESGTECLAGGALGSMIWSQAKEGRGSPEDEKGRHGGSLEIIEKTKYKKEGECCPLMSLFRLSHPPTVRDCTL